MIIKHLGDDMVKLSNPPKGKVEDERTSQQAGRHRLGRDHSVGTHGRNGLPVRRAHAH